MGAHFAADAERRARSLQGMQAGDRAAWGPFLQRLPADQGPRAFGFRRRDQLMGTRPPALAGEIETDVVIIGGGYTGLHAALNAAECGYRVVLLEAERIGWGASGRNGGQMIPGWRKGASELVKSFGAVKAKTLFGMALEARALTLEQIVKHNIDCDLTTNGHLTL